jgi:hypothetical protein
MTFIRPVWAGLLVFSANLVLRPKLCAGAGDTEKSQKIALLKKADEFAN